MNKEPGNKAIVDEQYVVVQRICPHQSQLRLLIHLQSQYVFIHDALNEKISCGSTEIVAANLRITINQLYRSTDSKQVSGFQSQFEVCSYSSRIICLSL